MLLHCSSTGKAVSRELGQMNRVFLFPAYLSITVLVSLLHLEGPYRETHADNAIKREISYHHIIRGRVPSSCFL